MAKRTGRHLYKHTLNAVFLGIFSVALTLLMLVYFVALTARTKSERREMILADTAARFEIINTELLTAFHSFSNVQKNSAMQALAQSGSPQEMYYNAIEVQQQLAESTLAANRLNYYSIAAVYLEQGRDLVLTPTESLSLETFSERIGAEREDLQQIYDELEEQQYDRSVLFDTGVNNGGKINYLTLHHYGSNDLLFVLSIDRENFTEAFAPLQCSDWMVCTQDKVLAAKNDDLSRYAPMIDHVRAQDTDLSGSLTLLDFSLNGENVMGASFSEIGWLFFATYASGTLSFTTLITMFLLPLLALVAGSVLVSKLLYRRLYAPVEELVTLLGGGVDEETNEFDYIREQTSQISEKARQLDAYLQRSQLLLTEQIYKNALLDANFDYEEAPPELEETSFVVVLAELAEDPTEADGFTMAKSLLRDTVRAEQDVHFVSMNDTSFVLVIHCEDTQQVRQRVQALFAQLGISARMQLRVALSSPAVGLKNLHMLMEQCNHLLEYRHSLPDQMFITAEDAAQIYYNGYYYPLKVEVNLVQMTVGGTEGALALLEEILHENLVNKILSPENRKSFFFALVSTLNRIYQELQLEGSDDYPPINDFLACADTDQLLQMIRTTFARIVWNTSQWNASIKQDVGERMMAYIRENYSQDISLDDMAERLNVSPKYCSALFKKQTGQTFKKVLNEYRIEKAREILQKTPDKRINDLAVEVGFTSANTFIQVFKQYTGTTPHQYATGV